MKTLVIIPAYNEEASILQVIEQLKKDQIEVDYLVVNDCSRDRTEYFLKQERASYITLPLNLGIGGAVQAGYQYALQNQYDIAVQLDGDGQHDSAYLKELLQPILDGQADVVIGSRFIKKEGFQSSGLRRMGISFLSNLIKMCTGLRIYDVTSGFRAVNRRMMEIYAGNYPADYPEPEAIVMAAREGMRICEVPVIMKERNGGISSISPAKSIYYMIKVSIAVVLCRILYQKEGRKLS